MPVWSCGHVSLYSASRLFIRFWNQRAGAGAVVHSCRAESQRLLGGHRRCAGVKAVFGPGSSASSIRQPVTIWALAHIPGESLTIFQPASDFSPSCRTQSFLPLRVGCCGPLAADLFRSESSAHALCICASEYLFHRPQSCLLYYHVRKHISADRSLVSPKTM